MDSKALQFYEMLKSGEIELTANGVSLGKVKVVASGKSDIEVFPPIERVSLIVQFPRE
jgi:hypothetical protein